MARTVAALSGGVDSAVAAAFAVERGDEVVGLTLRLYDEPKPSLDATGQPIARHKGSCCAPEDIADARRVAGQLGLPFYVLNASREFSEHVISPFLEAYRVGRTPLPCSACNTHLKFGHLLARARALGATLCTGHYARIGRRPDGAYRLLRARDERRDQSYFLYGLSQETLAHVDFPLGESLKSEVRAAAVARRLEVAEKPDSQELCFLSGSYADFVEARGATGKSGAVVDGSGEQLGVHAGVHRFTVGQRHGLPILSGPVPRYVTHIDGVDGTVTVGGAAELQRERIELEQVAYPGGERRQPFEALVRVRYQHAGEVATVTPLANGRAQIHFRQSVRAPAPGQAAVFYDGDEAVGGGLIV